MPNRAIYRGYSTHAGRGINTSVHDVECIQQDILAHFNTRRGERVGRPNFGCAIWDMLMDGGDDRIQALIRREGERIISYDPRVELLDMLTEILPDGHTIIISARVRLVNADLETTIDVEFNSSVG